jgi:hypothetical protein
MRTAAAVGAGHDEFPKDACILAWPPLKGKMQYQPEARERERGRTAD